MIIPSIIEITKLTAKFNFKKIFSNVNAIAIITAPDMITMASFSIIIINGFII